MRRVVLLVVAFALAASWTLAQDKVEITEGRKLPARPKTYVGDYAKVIDARAKQQLERKLAALRTRGKIEFVVVTVETTGAEDIFDYSLAAARTWRLAGGANDENGILLMIARRDRNWWVQVTRGLEADLPDAVLQEQGKKMVAPFRAGNFGAGINLFVDGLIAHLAGRRGFKMSGR